MRGAALAAALLVPAAAAADVTVINDQARFPEGPVVLDGTLHYVEYGGNTLMAWDGKENKVVWQQEGCGPSAAVRLGNDFLITCYDSGSIARVSPGGTTINYTTDTAGDALVGPNDIVLDGKGGAYFTASGPWETAPIVGKVYHLAADGSITMLADDIHYANGIELSLLGKMLYVNESEAGRVISFKVADDGPLSDRRLFVRLADLGIVHEWGPYPDGIKRDAKGNLWIGHYSAGQIAVVSQDGALLGTVDVPSPAAPNLAFSADGATVYVMAVDDTANAPYLGKVYAVPNPFK